MTESNLLLASAIAKRIAGDPGVDLPGCQSSTKVMENSGADFLDGLHDVQRRPHKLSPESARIALISSATFLAFFLRLAYAPPPAHLHWRTGKR